MFGSTAVWRGVAALGIAGAVFGGAVSLRYEQLATAERQSARNLERANAELQDALARMRDQLGGADQALNVAQRRLGELSDETRQRLAVSEHAATTRADRITQLTRSLEQAQRELHLAEAQRATLMARLSKSEVDAAQDQARQQQQLQTGNEQLQKKVQLLAADRDRAVGERDRLRARVGELEQRLSMLQTRQPQRPVAEAPPAAPPPAQAAAQPPAAPAATVPAATPEPTVAAAVPAPAVPAPAAAAPAVAAPAVVAAPAAPVQPAAPVTTAAVAPAPAPAPTPRAAAPVAVPAVAHGGIAQFERVLASAGIDVKHLYTQFGVNRGEGGPFIPAPRGTAPPQLSAEKLAALGRLVKSLPISAPLQSYDIGSRFGVRGDPINGRASLHTGTDFRAPYMSPVYATAAGVVSYSGYRADYGKIVEIDHGNGIATRYAHLHRATVSVGQHVAAHSQIGYLGSTGRATGPHVHYEVLVNGEPQNPEKFIGLGRIIPVVAQR